MSSLRPQPRSRVRIVDTGTKVLMSRVRRLGLARLNLDQALEEVRLELVSRRDLVEVVGSGLRKALDEVIDGPRTGRYRVEQLEKTEKTYIGTKVEIVLRNELGLRRGRLLDNEIAGHEVDTKFSLTGAWMIPREAVGAICLLVSADDNSSCFSIGLLRMSTDVLTAGANQDGKKSVSAAGRDRVVWLARNAPLPENLLLSLEDDVREQIMSQSSGMQRIRQLFLLVTGRLISRAAIEQVAQQKDPLRRARQMKDRLLESGVRVLCATYAVDRAEFVRHGFTDFKQDDWLSIPLA